MSSLFNNNSGGNTPHAHTESDITDLGSYADENHNHDLDYSDINHNHDSAYAAVDHTHESAGAHTHVEADITDLGSYADVNHNHDTDYAGISHNHDSDYSGISHNHDSDYAGISHSHNGLLPTVSTSDNDKILQVDSGVWTAKTFAGAQLKAACHLQVKTDTIIYSQNVSSVTEIESGVWQINFTNSITNPFVNGTMAVRYEGGNNCRLEVDDIGSSSCKVIWRYSSTGQPTNPAENTDYAIVTVF